MNEQLQNALALILQKAVTGVEEGVSFLSAELPDVAHQLLMWNMVYSIIVSALGMVVVISSLYVMIKYSGVGEKYEVESSHSKTMNIKHKYTLTHNDEGKVDGHVAFTIPVLTIICLSGLLTTNLTWLKIMIAPKLYLIEYAATLVK